MVLLHLLRLLSYFVIFGHTFLSLSVALCLIHGCIYIRRVRRPGEKNDQYLWHRSCRDLGARLGLKILCDLVLQKLLLWRCKIREMSVSTARKLTRLLKQLREQISESTNGDTGDKLNWKRLSLWLSLATQPRLGGRRGSFWVGVNTEAELWTYSGEGPTWVQLGSTRRGKTGGGNSNRCLGLTPNVPAETPQELGLTLPKKSIYNLKARCFSAVLGSDRRAYLARVVRIHIK